MADQDDVRRIALALPEVEEGTDRFGFSVHGKGFAWSYFAREAPKKPRVEHPEVLAVRTREKQELIASAPRVYFDDDHYHGFPAVLVRLAEIEIDELAEVITEGWRVQAPRRLVTAYDAEHPAGESRT